MTDKPPTPLHRIRDVRRREEMSVRTLARKLDRTVAIVKKMEHPDTDMRISCLRTVADAIGVPSSELLCDTDHNESQRLRGLLVRVTKAIHSLRSFQGRRGQRLCESILALIDEELPTAEINELHAVGQRRSLDDIGRAGTPIVIPPEIADTLLYKDS
jgi:hypothetical protein